MGVAFFVKSKSKSLKKIINNKNKINIVEYLPIRGGFSSYLFSIDNEEFFFIGHKTGNGRLVQMQKSNETYRVSKQNENGFSTFSDEYEYKTNEEDTNYVNDYDINPKINDWYDDSYSNW